MLGAEALTVSEIVLIITTTGGVIISIITAIKTNNVQVKQAIIQDQQVIIQDKVDVVHDLTNSRLSSIEDKLSASDAKLQSALIELEKNEAVREKLAQEAAHQIERDKLLTVTLEASNIGNLRASSPVTVHEAVANPLISITDDKETIARIVKP